MANLAYNMRPKTLDQIIGQHHLVDKGQILDRMVNANVLTSMILYGPPGIGKTSIANALSGSTGIPFKQFNASIDTKKELQAFAKEVDNDNSLIILVDEIHRLDKPKQDFLLPYMESGQFIIVGATTENPHISVNPAIRSRSNIFELQPITKQDMLDLINRALTDQENGLGNMPVQLDDDAKNFLATATNGDARSVLNALELAVKSTPEQNNQIHVTLNIIEQCLQRKHINGDKDGDEHYNVISAFQKSIRGSDTDAALHYLARILESGDLTIVVRRLQIIAFEDIGLANTHAGIYTYIACQSALAVGLPEARIPLADATVILALSPKSNSAYMGINNASDTLKQGLDMSIPRHLRDAHYKGASTFGNGVDYKYPHDYTNALVKQQYLPDMFQNHHYINFKDNSPEETRYHNTYNALFDWH